MAHLPKFLSRKPQVSQARAVALANRPVADRVVGWLLKHGTADELAAVRRATAGKSQAGDGDIFIGMLPRLPDELRQEFAQVIGQYAEAAKKDQDQ